MLIELPSDNWGTCICVAAGVPTSAGLCRCHHLRPPDPSLPYTLEGSSAPLTCMACASAFATVPAHRAHYRTEWHRFNLKRKVAGLMPIAEEQYLRRQAAGMSRLPGYSALSAACWAWWGGARWEA